MDVWGLIWFIALILALAGVMVLLNRLDRRAKNKSRENAYRLLDMENPPANELKKTIRDLHLYGGRLKKDKEFVQLRSRLTQKLDMLG